MNVLRVSCLFLLILDARPALADCQSEVATVLSAMRTAGPMRRQSKKIYKGAYDGTVTRDYSPPDQVQETADSGNGEVNSTVLVSGKSGWSIIKNVNQPNLPIYEVDGSSFVTDTLVFRLPPDPVTDCAVVGDELQLIWKADGGSRSQVITARADAKTHLLKTLDGIIKRKDGTTESEEHATYSKIAAFTVTPPKGAVKPPSGPDYVKISDVDPLIPMPSDAVKIRYAKGIDVSYESPQKLAALVEFYRSHYTAADWKEEAGKLTDTAFIARYRHAKLGWFQVEMEAGDNETRVRIDGPNANN